MRMPRESLTSLEQIRNVGPSGDPRVGRRGDERTGSAPGAHELRPDGADATPVAPSPAPALRQPASGIKLSMMSPLRFFRTLRDERRQFGWKGLLKRRGWVFVALVVLVYLVRDLVLYVLVPLAVVAGLRH